MANPVLLARVAGDVETLIAQNRTAVARFKKQIKVSNRAWRKYWRAKTKEPQPYDDPTGKNGKDGYEYDPDFKMRFPIKCPPLPPDPTKWQLSDKLPCYYVTLAVIYYSVKGNVAPFRLCEGILDDLLFGYMQLCISRAWGFNKDMLDTALKWVKADLTNLSPAGIEQKGAPAKAEKGDITVQIEGDVRAENLQIGHDAYIHKQTGTVEKKKGIFKRLLKIIDTIIVALFIAFLADILGHLGWTRRITDFIYGILAPK